MALAKKVIAISLIYLQLMSISFVFLPVGIRSIMALLGLIVFVKKKDFRNFISSKVIKLSFFMLAIGVAISFISIFANNTRDFYYLLFLVSQLNTLFASLFLIYIFAIKFKLNTSQVIDFTITAIFLFALSGIIFFINPNLQETANSMLAASSSYAKEFEEGVKFRLLSFGPKFFGAGVISGLGLILIVYRFCTANLSVIKKFIFTAFYLIILFGGIFAARTTLIGFAVSVMTYIYFAKLFSFKNIAILVSITLLLVSTTSYLMNNSERLGIGALTKFGFEMINNFEANKGLQTNSTNDLISMIKFPKRFTTYILGDGFFTDPQTGYFYQDTDIGYLRIIYYSGIFSLITLLIFFLQIFRAKQMKVYFGNFFPNLLLLYFIILFFKGVTDINSFLFLIIGMIYFENKTRIANEATNKNPY